MIGRIFKKRILRIFHNDKGAAMIVVLCVMAVTLVLCLSLLLNSSILMKSTESCGNREQGRVIATTLSQVIDKIIQNPQSDLASVVTGDILGGRWVNYDEDLRGQSRDQAFRYYSFDRTELQSIGSNVCLDSLEDSQVIMYWEKEELDQVGDDGVTIETRYTLFITVSVKVGGRNCSVLQSYDGSDKTTQLGGTPVFTWANNDTEE